MKKRLTFQEIIEQAKIDGTYRVMTPNESIEDIETFRKNMKKAKEDYNRMRDASERNAWNKRLR